MLPIWRSWTQLLYPIPVLFCRRHRATRVSIISPELSRWIVWSRESFDERTRQHRDNLFVDRMSGPSPFLLFIFFRHRCTKVWWTLPPSPLYARNVQRCPQFFAPGSRGHHITKTMVTTSPYSPTGCQDARIPPDDLLPSGHIIHAEHRRYPPRPPNSEGTSPL